MKAAISIKELFSRRYQDFQSINNIFFERNYVGFDCCPIFIWQIQFFLTIIFQNLKSSMDQIHLKSSPIKKFIKKLHSILKIPQYTEYICWNSDGTIVQIKNPQQFEKEVVPLHFRLKKMASFIRQLHLYDFHKIKGQDGSLKFHNANFTRDNISQMKEIKRKRLTKSMRQELLKQKKQEAQSKTVQENLDEPAQLQNENCGNFVLAGFNSDHFIPYYMDQKQSINQSNDSLPFWNDILQ